MTMNNALSNIKEYSFESWASWGYTWAFEKGKEWAWKKLSQNSQDLDIKTKHIFKSFILNLSNTGLLPLPENIQKETSKTTNYKNLSIVGSIIFATDLLLTYLEKEELATLTLRGSSTGTATALLFDQNLYTGALLGGLINVPLGLFWDYIDSKTSTFLHINAIAQDWQYGIHLFTLFALGSINWTYTKIPSASWYNSRIRPVISLLLTASALSLINLKAEDTKKTLKFKDANSSSPAKLSASIKTTLQVMATAYINLWLNANEKTAYASIATLGLLEGGAYLYFIKKPHPIPKPVTIPSQTSSFRKLPAPAPSKNSGRKTPECLEE